MDSQFVDCHVSLCGDQHSCYLSLSLMNCIITSVPQEPSTVPCPLQSSSRNATVWGAASFTSSLTSCTDHHAGPGCSLSPCCEVRFRWWPGTSVLCGFDRPQITVLGCHHWRFIQNWWWAWCSWHRLERIPAVKVRVDGISPGGVRRVSLLNPWVFRKAFALLQAGVSFPHETILMHLAGRALLRWALGERGLA